MGELMSENKQLRAEAQKLKEKAAYNIGRAAFLEKQVEDFKRQLRELDAKEARP
jgi:regulator of replication initiation timing